MITDYATYFTVSIYIFGGFGGLVSGSIALIYGILALAPAGPFSETNVPVGVTLIVFSLIPVTEFIGLVIGAIIGIIITCFFCTIMIVVRAIRDTLKLIYYNTISRPNRFEEQINEKYKEIVV